jgi:hypothetical protein
MGEASGSQLRIWANGCPSVVSDTGWYATLPDSCVRKVGIDSESVDLGILLSELAEGRVDLEKLAAEGYAQLQLHAPDCYVSDLIDWIDQGCIVMGEKWAQARFIDAAARGYSESLPLRQVVNLPAGLRTVSTYG